MVGSEAIEVCNFPEFVLLGAPPPGLPKGYKTASIGKTQAAANCLLMFGCNLHQNSSPFVKLIPILFCVFLCVSPHHYQPVDIWQTLGVYSYCILTLGAPPEGCPHGWYFCNISRSWEGSVSSKLLTY